MIKGKNIVILGKGDARKIQDFERVYLEFGSCDKLVSFNKTSDGAVVKTDDGKEWEGLRPAGLAETPQQRYSTCQDAGSLLTEALNYFAQPEVNEVFGGSTEKPVPAEICVLMAASDGYDLMVRARIQNSLKPKAAMDPVKARQKSIEAMIADALSRGKKLTLEQATKRYDLLKQMEEEEEGVTA